jgi:hypothetical protein
MRTGWSADWKQAAYGMAGGIAGGIAVIKTGDKLFQLEGPETVHREHELRQELPVEVLAGRIVTLFGGTPTKRRKEQLGYVLLWASHAAYGAAYGMMRRRFRWLRRTLGVSYGLVYFLVRDELVNTLFGLVPPPRSFPLAAHARGVATHVAYGITTEVTCRALEGVFG